MFELSNVSFSHEGDDFAVRDISFKINEGEAVSIIGANGSGKSTILSVMGGLIYPQKGNFLAFGREITEKTFRDENFNLYFRKRIGFVFQNPDIQLFNGTVMEEMLFGPLQMGFSVEEAKSRAFDMLELLNIAHLKNKPPYRLSGGEKRRVAIGSVLTVNPDILIMDEPTTGLDPKSQVWLLKFLEMFKESEKTLIIATHELELAKEITERTILVAENHTVADDGKTTEILADKALLLTNNLIHEHSHKHGNVLHSHVHAHGLDHSH